MKEKWICAAGMILLAGCLLLGCGKQTEIYGTLPPEETTAVWETAQDTQAWEETMQLTKEDHYQVASSIPVGVIEAFAEAVKADILLRDWASLSQKISYPIRIDYFEVSDGEGFRELDFATRLNPEFVKAMEEENCRQMFCNWQGISMGAAGQIWFGEILDRDGSSELKIIGINGLLLEEGADSVLKEMEMLCPDGRRLTLSVLGKQNDTGLWGVREVLVRDEEKLVQSILIQEAIREDGVDGIDTGYSQCDKQENAAALRDVNFDGWPDLEVCGWLVNNSIPYYYWCWNQEMEMFEYAFCLQLTEVDEQKQELISWHKVENGLYYTDHYRVGQDYALELTDREIEDVRPK